MGGRKEAKIKGVRESRMKGERTGASKKAWQIRRKEGRKERRNRERES